MSEHREVTVVLCTYNRAQLLGAALDRLLAQSADSPAYEIILVDNNSSDDTRAVVERYTSSTARPVRYVFEPRQGRVHARNAGIAASRADIIAFTDDDVWVTDDWVRVIKRTFDAQPEVDGLGGRTLPIWPSDPPAWLTRRHWVGPLALQDYGDEPFTVDARHPLCLAGANCAFRKERICRLGGFSPEFERSEDTEFMLRLWRAGTRALYVPDMKVFAAVQPERLTKRYHREWHTNIGRCNARMQLWSSRPRTGQSGRKRRPSLDWRVYLGSPCDSSPPRPSSGSRPRPVGANPRPSGTRRRRGRSSSTCARVAPGFCRGIADGPDGRRVCCHWSRNRLLGTGRGGAEVSAGPVLVIGVDAGEPTLIERWMDQGLLPTMARLRASGIYTRLKTPEYCRAETACTVFLTGCEPSRTGQWCSFKFHPADYGIGDLDTYPFDEYPPFYALGPGRRVAVFDVPADAPGRRRGRRSGARVGSSRVAHRKRVGARPPARRVDRPARRAPDVRQATNARSGIVRRWNR